MKGGYFGIGAVGCTPPLCVSFVVRIAPARGPNGCRGMCAPSHPWGLAPVVAWRHVLSSLSRTVEWAQGPHHKEENTTIVSEETVFVGIDVGKFTCVAAVHGRKDVTSFTPRGRNCPVPQPLGNAAR